MRSNSASRYAQSAQKPALAKSQSVEEIRKKAQVSGIVWHHSFQLISFLNV